MIARIVPTCDAYHRAAPAAARARFGDPSAAGDGLAAEDLFLGQRHRVVGRPAPGPGR
jgi:hypothetical protein